VRSGQLGIIITVVMCFFPAVALLNYFSRKLQERRRKAQQAFDVDEFRRELLSSDGFDREVYDRDLKPVVDRLEAQYGRLVPTSELASLQHLVAAKISDVETRRQAVIDREAAKGGTIAMTALRRRMDEAKLTYNGPNRDLFSGELDSLLDSRSAKYGDTIPVDQAYALMKRLEASWKFHPCVWSISVIA